MLNEDYRFNVVWGWKSPTWSEPVERVMHSNCTREQGLQYVENYFSAFGSPKALNYWELPYTNNEIQYVKLEKAR